MRIKIIILWIICIFSLSGCVPVRYTLKPGISTTIIDAQTKTPIENAIIKIYKNTESDKWIEIASEESDNKGQCLIKSKGKWGLHCLMMDSIVHKYAITIEKENYKKYTKEVYGTIATGPAIYKLEKIKLEKN
ncbi:MAG: hypothetical protein JSV34_00720 [Candidatus Omnitrophota bacterium]|nr:MAG: hypothetical protein JSV34_00720 [Candidatus Omnitrophota bacterium]